MRYFRYYFRLCYARLLYDFSKGHNLPVAIMGSACFFFMHVAGFSLVVSKFSFPNWTLSELWILFFVFELYLYACFQMFFRGLLYTRQDIIYGKFDYHLVKPANVKFLSLIREGSLNNLVNFLLSVVFLVGLILVAQISVSLLQIVLFSAILAVSLLQFHFVSGALTTLNFKYGDIGNTATIVYKFNEVWKYPSEAYLANPLAAMFVYPLALTTSIPALILLGRGISWWSVGVYLVFTLFLFVIYKVSWTKALRNYSSASS